MGLKLKLVDTVGNENLKAEYCLLLPLLLQLLQSCLTLCDPIDGSPPSSSVPGILQARILEWVAISFSRVLSTLV